METFDGIIDCHNGDPACLTIDRDNSSLTQTDDMRFALILCFLESTKIMFLIITSKQITLESRAKSQIVGNSFAVPDLM